MNSPSNALELGPNITVLPVVHGSGEFSTEVRRLMLTRNFDCVAVPLPRSFQTEVESAVLNLPAISVVLQKQNLQHSSSDHSLFDDSDDDDEFEATCSYVPIDPCQPVIAGLRIAIQEHIPRAFIDIEDEDYLPFTSILPDPYALKHVSVEQFGAAVVPALPTPEAESHICRLHWMANELHDLKRQHDSILLICSVTDWPWIRDAYQTVVDRPAAPDAPAHPAVTCSVEQKTLSFVLGELPFITTCYENARKQLDDDENLSIDGIKNLLLASRINYQAEFGPRARPMTPQLFKVMLKYIRNLSLMDRRLTPSLYTLVTAAQQIAGDQFAIQLAQTARSYAYESENRLPEVRFGINRIQLADFSTMHAVSRLPGHPIVWRTCQLRAPADRKKVLEWKRTWNPFGQCSWPPEDVAIEQFRTHIKDAALDLIGNDLARTEKFTSSLKDGLDIRETLRNWHTGELYVREFPPARGNIDCVVMLFDSPADPRNYPWRITWQAENHDESTLSLFATDFNQDVIGPGIALARYGGCMFLFPPRPVPDIFQDPQFDFADTLEERLLAAALTYSEEKHIALLSHKPPGAGWRRLAKKHSRSIVHVPMGRFGAATIDKLRTFHVLNGHEVRSFAADFIRNP